MWINEGTSKYFDTILGGVQFVFVFGLLLNM